MPKLYDQIEEDIRLVKDIRDNPRSDTADLRYAIDVLLHVTTKRRKRR